MAQKVAAMDVRMAAALAVGAVSNVSVFCREQQISRQTFYKWRARFVAGGIEGLTERSRRPRSCPSATDAQVVEAIVRTRKELADAGADHGPDPIRWHLLQRQPQLVVPSRSTIARILADRGLVSRTPQRRPRSSLHRFVYPRPNECWQSDWTGYRLADGREVAIAGTLDDHSRVLVGIDAQLGDGTADLVWQVMCQAIAEWGVPQRSLTDNGLVYSGYRRGITVAFETNLRALGCHPICSSPYHPQTCGKIERSWQTLKKWLDAHGPYPELPALRTALTTYRDYYNHHRPHRALRGATPATAYAATPQARPADRPLPAPITVHHNTVNRHGVVQLPDYIIGVGRHHAGKILTTIADGTHLTLFHHHTLIRVLDADPTRKYQRQTPH